MPHDKHLRCNFCGKSKDQVKKFISGPGVYICNECVIFVNVMLAEETVNAERRPGWVTPFYLLSDKLEKVRELDKRGVAHPNFIRDAMRSDKSNSLEDFLEVVFGWVNAAIEDASALPQAFDGGLVHVLRGGRALCGFTLNIPRYWPENQNWLPESEGSTLVNCTNCKDILEDETRHPPPAA